MKRWCSFCQAWKDEELFSRSSSNSTGFQYACRTCHALKMREWRARNPGVEAARAQADPDFRRKLNARSLIRMRRKRGALKEEPCSICGTEHDVEAHHPDYSKPDEVVWLCRFCHGAEHYPEAQPGYRSRQAAKLDAIIRKHLEKP